MRAMSALRLEARRGAVPLGLILVMTGAVAKLLTVAAAGIGYRATFCMFKLTTGCPCMSCGGTRALNRLLALDLPGAFAMNPLATAAMLALLPWALVDGVLFLRGRALSVEVSEAFATVLRPLLIVVVFVNWAYLVAVGR
jgi:hypothetical protein